MKPFSEARRRRRLPHRGKPLPRRTRGTTVAAPGVMGGRPPVTPAAGGRTPHAAGDRAFRLDHACASCDAFQIFAIRLQVDHPCLRDPQDREACARPREG